MRRGAQVSQHGYNAFKKKLLELDFMFCWQLPWQMWQVVQSSIQSIGTWLSSLRVSES